MNIKDEMVMQKSKQIRIMAVLGAGAVLDFDFDGIENPTTANITKIVSRLKVKGLDLEEIDLIKQVYDKIVHADENEYLRIHSSRHSYESRITFEELFEVLETLYSFNATWKHEHYPIALISSLVKSDLKYETVEYQRALQCVLECIIDIVNAYNVKFTNDGTENWYKNFWKKLAPQLDVFNFNYDTTIENSLENYVDGFVPFNNDVYERFEPEILWNVKPSDATICHLHGCILYGDANPKLVQHYYNHRDLYKFKLVENSKSCIGRQWFPNNQNNEDLCYFPIITGLKKTDKLCYMPQSIYHAFMVRKMIENPSLLICGYSFGDLYVNQILERHKLIHADRQRVIIIEKWPNYIEENIQLYNYFKDKTSPGFQGVVARLIETGESLLKTFEQFEKVEDGCWQSANGHLRIYTNGFKHAVEFHQDEILKYLYLGNNKS